MEEKNIEIYTDGACKYNPGPGGWAYIIIYNGLKKGGKGKKIITTNNEMELQAVLKSLEYLEKENETYDINNAKINIHSDSNYIVQAIEKKWIDNWKNKNWKAASGDTVKNIEQWKLLLNYLKKYNITFIKVKGHSTDELNNLCDKYAVEEATVALNIIFEEMKKIGMNITSDVEIRKFIESKNINTINNINNNIIEDNEEKNILDSIKKEQEKILEEDAQDKEKRQSDTIFALIKENNELKRQIIELKKEVERFTNEK